MNSQSEVRDVNRLLLLTEVRVDGGESQVQRRLPAAAEGATGSTGASGGGVSMRG